MADATTSSVAHEVATPEVVAAELGALFATAGYPYIAYLARYSNRPAREGEAPAGSPGRRRPARSS